MDSLSARAAALGIDPVYVDGYGVRRSIEQDSLRRIIDAVGSAAMVPAKRRLPASVVLRQGRSRPLVVHPLPPHATLRWQVASRGERIASGHGRGGTLRLPSDLPLGTYRLEVTIEVAGGKVREAVNLLVVPERAYQGDASRGAGRSWALAAQLYGVRSHRNWGHGDFTDLAALLELSAKLGAAGVSLNPLHALFADRPEEASPYSPNSRLFLNPLYIDLDAVPEFPGVREAGLVDSVERLRRAEFVDYSGVAAAKLGALRLAYARFRESPDPSRARDLSAFCQERGAALARFATFETLRGSFARPWWEWPTEWRQPSEEVVRRVRESAPDEVGFQEYTQWVADRQLRSCYAHAQRLGRAIGVFADVAVGFDPAGADGWSEQGAMLAGISLGAPPDMYNVAGQDWGIAGFNPHRLEAQGFDPFRRTLSAAMRYAGAVRLDHVLGLNRLFVVPNGSRPLNGAYLRFPFEAMLAVVAQESVAHRSIVVGEDLGTVPENLRSTLADWGIWSYRVMLFERGRDGSFLPPEQYAENALVTFTTHDLPSFAGWWAGHDLRTKRALGIDPGESDGDRDRARQALREALASRGFMPNPRVDFLAVARYLAATPCRLLVISLEDAVGIVDQPNLPGTIHEHPNWRRRLSPALEELGEDGRLRELARAMAVAGRAS
jgi:4-alpha-glucanotransferase